MTSVATLLLRKSTRFHDKKTLDSQKTLDCKYVTDLSDYKKIGFELKNRQVFGEHYTVYLFVSEQIVHRTHTRKRLTYSFTPKIFQSDLKCNTFT